MTVKCKNCGYKAGQPTASSCLGCFLWIIFTEILIIVAVRLVRKHPFNQCWLALAIMTALWCFATFYTFLPGYWAKLRYIFTPCPQCGAREWSNGFYSGFGL